MKKTIIIVPLLLLCSIILAETDLVQVATPYVQTYDTLWYGAWILVSIIRMHIYGSIRLRRWRVNLSRRSVQHSALIFVGLLLLMGVTLLTPWIPIGSFILFGATLLVLISMRWAHVGFEPQGPVGVTLRALLNLSVLVGACSGCGWLIKMSFYTHSISPLVMYLTLCVCAWLVSKKACI